MVFDLMLKILPVLDGVRSAFMKIAELIAKIGNLNSENIYYVLFIFISIFIAGKILNKDYVNMKGRVWYIILLAGLIFYLLVFLGK